MTRDELREKVFDIVKGISNQSSTCGGFDDYECKEEADDILDTIFAAMKEPTEEMTKQGARYNTGTKAYQVMHWQAMLSASALAPKEK